METRSQASLGGKNSKQAPGGKLSRSLVTISTTLQQGPAAGAAPSGAC